MSHDPAFDILIIEDSATLRELYSMLLKTAGYRIAFAENGQQAVEFFGAGKSARLMLLDMVMPVMDGKMFLEWLKENSHHQSQVVVLTQLDTSAKDFTHLPRELVAAILQKPIDGPGLMSVVAHLCPLPGRND